MNDKSRKLEQIQRLLLLCFLCPLLCLSVFALDRDRSLKQFHHTAWTAKDGAPSQISSLAQTSDGYLWIGSARGLFKFDGVEFEPYVPPSGISLPSHNINALLATPDGGLWIGFRPAGVAFLRAGHLRVFSRPEELPKSEVFGLAQDRVGRIWASTLTGLALFEGERWIDIGSDWKMPSQRVWAMFTDRDGTFWVGIGDTVTLLRPGAQYFQQTGIRTLGVPRIAQANDGRLWITEWAKHPRTMPAVNGVLAAADIEIQIEAVSIFFDRAGSLWMSDYRDGVKRIRFPERLAKGKFSGDSQEIESFGAWDGLTSNTAFNFLEDREGNVWASSSKGLDRFSYRPFSSVELPAPYSNLTLLTGESGEVWVATTIRDSLLRVSGEKVIKTSGPMEVASVFRDSSGISWWGNAGGIWKQNSTGFEFFPRPSTLSGGVWEIFPADDPGGLWARMGDIGLVHFKNGVWADRETPKGLPGKGPSSSFKDQQGRVWLGYSSGEVYFLDGGQVQSFSRNDGIDIGKIKVIRGLGAQIWLGGETGLAMFNDGRFSSVNTVGEPFRAISGIVETKDGGLWLNETTGIVHIPASERRQLLTDPTHRISYRLYDIHDGIPGGPQINYTVSTAVEASDGRLWFATDSGLTWIDPVRIKTNKLPPPVVVKSLTTEEKTYQSNETLQLPKGTENLRISYTALSLSVPERVHFKYRLEGINHDWNYAGTRREAFFTNLGPGTYRFRVIASNNDGVWNEEGAVLDFTILPRFYQTNWFLAICAAALALLSLLGYNWRLRRVKTLLQSQFRERLAERTRIAQDLHDTLLQGFVSAKMQLFAEVQDLPPETLKTKRLKGVYEMLGQLIEEGRNTVRDLRASASDDSTDFEQEFLKVREAFDIDKKIDFKIVIGGIPRPLHPSTGSELLQIAHEALINAFLHSHATAIEIEIEYGLRSLNLFVRDNGCGIDSEIMRSGREGHWGLTGMRERAEKIKAEIKFLSRVNAGTEIVVSVPRRFAFKNAGVLFPWRK